MAIHPIMLSTLLADVITHGAQDVTREHGLGELGLVGFLPTEVSPAWQTTTRRGVQKLPPALASAGLTLDMVCWALKKRAWPLSSSIKVGRDPGNDVILPHPSISKKHAEMGWEGHQLMVTDLGSGNGTKVGIQPVGAQPVPVSDGAMLTLGDLSLSVMSSARLLQLLLGG